MERVVRIAAVVCEGAAEVAHVARQVHGDGGCDMQRPREAVEARECERAAADGVRERDVAAIPLEGARTECDILSLRVERRRAAEPDWRRRVRLDHLKRAGEDLAHAVEAEHQVLVRLRAVGVLGDERQKQHFALPLRVHFRGVDGDGEDAAVLRDGDFLVGEDRQVARIRFERGCRFIARDGYVVGNGARTLDVEPLLDEIDAAGDGRNACDLRGGLRRADRRRDRVGARRRAVRHDGRDGEGVFVSCFKALHGVGCRFVVGRDIYGRAGARPSRDVEREAGRAIGVARRDVPLKRHFARRNFRERLELDNLLRTEPDLEIGELARAAARFDGGLEVLPADAVAPAVVGVDIVDFAIRADVLDGVAVDDHLVDGRVDLDRRAELEVVRDGAPEVVVAVASLAHHLARLVPVVLGVAAELARRVRAARLEAHVHHRLHPHRQKRGVVADFLVRLPRRGCRAGRGHLVPVDRNAAVWAHRVVEGVVVTVAQGVGERTRLLETIRPAPVPELLSARRRGASARARQWRQVGHRRALRPCRAEEGIDEVVVSIADRRARRRGGKESLFRVGGGVFRPAGIDRRRRIRLFAGDPVAGVLELRINGRARFGFREVVRRERNDRRTLVAPGEHDVAGRRKRDDPQIAARGERGDGAPVENPLRGGAAQKKSLRSPTCCIRIDGLGLHRQGRRGDYRRNYKCCSAEAHSHPPYV